MNYVYPEKFDVIVVGAGNAGVEAAAAASRMGCKTLLLTHNFENLGQQSCNPSIGGIGKGHLVRELDALDGFMGRITDKSGIQFRTLNASKGAAVRATRAQIDRRLYKKFMRREVEGIENLSLLEVAVDDLIIDGGSVVGIRTQSDMTVYARSVVLTAGTFLNGMIHIGTTHYSAGRVGDPASIALGHSLKSIGLPQGRLKTGTPARLDGRTIDFTKCTPQVGDFDPIPVFSFLSDESVHPRQVPCYITNTNLETHDIIRSGLDRSPLYSGIIKGIGPRYCPSIEDKIHRFADKASHQVYLEPEGLDTYECYPNGISTSLPYDIQVRFIRSIPGLENVHILRPGYAIEYDYFDPTALKNTFESKMLDNLFLAGQVNGTTGYEEAAAQGLFAGINAALKVQEKEGFTLRRDQAYLGVLVDDLITKGVNEPYRMFTSRAEYRLSLREDNADQRLTPLGYKLGVVSDIRWRAFNEKMDALAAEQNRLRDIWINPRVISEETNNRFFEGKLQKENTLLDLLKRPNFQYSNLFELKNKENECILITEPLPRDLGELLETQVKYAGYIARQAEEIKKELNQEAQSIPKDFDYEELKGLSTEIRQKLEKIRPETVGQASRISGITPAAISLILIYLKKYGKKSAE